MGIALNLQSEINQSRFSFNEKRELNVCLRNQPSIFTKSNADRMIKQSPTYFISNLLWK